MSDYNTNSVQESMSSPQINPLTDITGQKSFDESVSDPDSKQRRHR